LLDYFYSALVEEMPEPDTLNVRQLSERVLDRAGIRNKVSEKYRLPVSVTDSALFDYRYENGALHLMKRVTLAYEDERSWTSVDAATWDFEKAALRLSEDGGQLIALVKTRPSDSELRLQMGLLNNLASVVDGPVQQAASKLTKLLHAAP
jgi:hypothetical protein